MRSSMATPPQSLGPHDCLDWFAADVAMLVCDPNGLDQAITQGTFGSTPISQITLADRAIGGGQGIAQALGNPLRPGEQATVRLPAGGQPIIYLRWRDPTGQVRIITKPIVAPASRLVQIVEPANGTAPALTLLP